jgi:ABC-2 type transport system permease protein
MNHFLAVLIKELLLLKRDRAGLAVLFLMPAVLVLVITLVQQNALSTIGEGRTTLLFIDGDQDALGNLIHEALAASPGVDLRVMPDGDRAKAIAMVDQGECQLYLRLPPGTTARVRARARQLAGESLKPREQAGKPEVAAATIELHFDPTVLGGLRSAVRHLLELMLLRLEVEEKVAALGERLPEALDTAFQEALGPMTAMAESLPRPTLDLSWPRAPLMEIASPQVAEAAHHPLPNATQHNVPAWSLFGIFFIVLPMAGTFIKERHSGVALRLRSLPVSYTTLMAGKVGAYLLVCLGQLALIVSIGRWILPLCGAPAFTLDAAPLALGIVTASVILAATGYGVFLGTVVRSYEQAAMVGPISIVIAAAVGGIMVPVYAMPEALQRISLASPLAWGLNAFIELFVRRGEMADVTPEAAALSGFALACLLSAGWLRRLRRRRP